MSIYTMLNSIDVVAGVLPFRLDDYARVNQAFAESAETGSAESRRSVEVWTYCFVSRYFALKFVRSGRPALSDLDRLIDRASQRIRRGAPRLRSPGRYTSWVNTVCRNVYLNYVRSYRLEWLDDPENVVADTEDGDSYDVGLLAETLSKAIDDLPQFLREAARLRLISGLTYREMSAKTGRPIPTLRAYANRSVKLIRRNPRLKKILSEMIR